MDSTQVNDLRSMYAKACEDPDVDSRLSFRRKFAETARGRHLTVSELCEQAGFDYGAYLRAAPDPARPERQTPGHPPDILAQAEQAAKDALRIGDDMVNLLEGLHPASKVCAATKALALALREFPEQGLPFVLQHTVRTLVAAAYGLSDPGQVAVQCVVLPDIPRQNGD